MLRGAVSRHTLKAVGQNALTGGSSSNEPMHPNLGLHSAAATGNIGLVQFALENGQPANSNLNGILPLHAACSGGSEQAVRMLLIHGADVNAPRLKSKGSGGGPGAEGSTPLHFAAANGHFEIVRILLEAGARPAAADKEGVLAESLALGNGHADCANLIRSWISAYGSNGLYGIVSSREAVSRDVSVGPAAYIRYASATSSNSKPSAELLTRADDYDPSSASTLASNVGSSRPDQVGTLLRSRRSFDQLKSAPGPRSPSVPIGLRQHNIPKTASNPNLKGESSAQPQSIPPVPTPRSAFSDGMSTSSLTQDSLNLSHMDHGHYQDRSADYLQQPTNVPFGRSPSPLGPEEEAEIAFASAVTPPVGGRGGPPSSLSTAATRESKRRPSLPSILEKAAHPAASIRAALAASANAGSSDHPEAAPNSPGRRMAKLAGKRSLSNMLRKATGGSTISNSTSTCSLAASTISNGTEVGVASTTSPMRPSRPPRASFDVALPHAGSTGVDSRYSRLDRRYASLDPYGGSSDDSDGWKVTPTSPHGATSTSSSSSQQRKDAAEMPTFHHRLRGSASSSALSSDAAAQRVVARARSGSTDQKPSSQAGLGASMGRGAPVSLRKGSLDLLRADYGYHSSGTSASQAASHYRQRNTSSLSNSSAGGRQGTLDDWTGHALESSSDVTSSDGSLTGGARNRSASGSSRPSQMGEYSTDGTLAYLRSPSANVKKADDADETQEFLGDTKPLSPEEAAGEHHDVHHLPAGLRSLAAMRAPRQDTMGSSRLAGGASGTMPYSNPSSPLVNPIQRNRNRSTSSLSATSMGSQPGTGTVSAPANLTDTPGTLRDSPSLASATQSLSIADEVGFSQPAPTRFGGGRPGRSGSGSGSQTGSLGTHASSSSSLRSNYLSAAEQAQAILNQEAGTVDGPGGAPLSLAAQLAAYGEALALERKRAGEARSGPSPGAGSARGTASSTALKSALPSVSEDQSPTRPNLASNLRRGQEPISPAANGQESNRPGDAGAVTASASENTQPHRSHSRQGNNLEPPSLGRQQSSGAEADRSNTCSQPGRHTGLRKLFLDAPSSSNLEVESNANLGLGSPLSPKPALTNNPSEGGGLAPGSNLTSGQSSGDNKSHLGRLGGTPLSARGRASEDLLREQRPPILTWNSGPTPGSGNRTGSASDSGGADLPKTPQMWADGADSGDSSWSRPSHHRHSPSAPSELSAYALGRRDRSPMTLASGGSTPSLPTGHTPPVPPRKDSIAGPGSNGQLLMPDAAHERGWRAPSSGSIIGLGLNGSSDELSKRRPSTNTVRQGYDGSGADGDESTVPLDEFGTTNGGNGGGTKGSGSSGRRRLVREFLNGIKGAGSTPAS